MLAMNRGMELARTKILKSEVKFANDVAETAIVLARNCNVRYSQLADTATRLHIIAPQLHNLAELHCERNLTESEKENRYELRDEATRILTRLNEVPINPNALIFWEFNSDPRGPSIKLYLPDKTSNSFAGETWGISNE